MDRTHLPTRVVRRKPGEPWPTDAALADERGDALTPSECLALMWPLTEEAYRLAGVPLVESRLPRHVVRVERRGR